MPSLNRRYAGLATEKAVLPPDGAQDRISHNPVAVIADRGGVRGGLQPLAPSAISDRGYRMTRLLLP